MSQGRTLTGRICEEETAPTGAVSLQTTLYSSPLRNPPRPAVRLTCQHAGNESVLRLGENLLGSAASAAAGAHHAIPSATPGAGRVPARPTCGVTARGCPPPPRRQPASNPWAAA